MTGRTKEVDHAINLLRDFDTVSTYEKYWGIVENYILSLEEQKPCNDCISRQYLVEKAVSWDKHFTDSERYVSLTDIQNAPPVMREATQEEREGVDQYIDSIAEPKLEKSCKNCKHSDKGMINTESGRCEACYYDSRLGGNCLFEEQPKQRMGRWEWVQYDGNPNIGNWHCSECNRIVCGAITAVNPVYAYKYCPECGAKMQEVDE